MKKRSFALAMAFALTLALTGCSAGREINTQNPSHSVTGSDSGVYETNDGNDAFEGGGAGGTNDLDNDGQPDPGDNSGVDDIGRAAGDLARGTGDVARDAGDAIGDAIDNVGRAMR